MFYELSKINLKGRINMKATKMMALGLVGLTTLGLAATANAADSSQVKTQASITFSTGSESGNQDGPNGEVAPGNPVDETPNYVNGWKMAVPSVLTFEGNAVNGTLKDDDGQKRNIYNPGSATNDYKSTGVAYANGSKGPFFLRFDAEGDETKEGKFQVKVKRSPFKVNDQVLDKDSSSYITIPEFSKAKNVEVGVADGAVVDVKSESVKLIDSTDQNIISEINLNTGGKVTSGFVVNEAADGIGLHIGANSQMLKNLSRSTVTTELTWTFAAGVASGE